MNFLLTNYIFPIKSKLPLSKHLKMYFDNPRTDEEIRLVKEYIRGSYEIKTAFQATEEDIQGFLHEFLKIYGRKDKYIKAFGEKFEDLSSYELLARMWVIVRYDDKGLHKALNNEGKKRMKKGERGIFILEDDHPIPKNSRTLTELSHFISLCINTNDKYYFGQSFLLDYRDNWFSNNGIRRPNHLVGLNVVKFVSFIDDDGTLSSDSESWSFFPNVMPKLTEVTTLIESAFQEDTGEKLLYISSLLRAAGHDVSDEKTKIVILVSVIELLLTHNPDFNRFNIEDSINKQFQLKAATLIYLNSQMKDIKSIKRRLKEIYSLRSSISHGDFKGVNKYIETYKKKGEKYPLDALISELYLYLKIIIFAYLKDRIFVDFLKES